MCVQVEPRCWDFSRSGCMASCCTIDIVVLALDAAVPSTTSFDVVHVLIATAGKLLEYFPRFHDRQISPWLAMLLTSSLGRLKGCLDTSLFTPQCGVKVIQVGTHYMPIFLARNGCVYRRNARWYSNHASLQNVLLCV